MKKFLLIAMFMQASWLYAQEIPEVVPEETQPAEEIENLVEKTETEGDYSEYFYDLEDLKQSPAKINLGFNEINRLPLLNEAQKLNLNEYIRKNGALFSAYELVLIDGFDVELGIKLLPYISFETSKPTTMQTWKRALKYGRNVAFYRTSRVLEKQKGFMDVSDSIRQKAPNSYYLGDPWKQYFQYRFYYSNVISLGFTAEKDAGEEFFKGNRKDGFDFYSAHVFLNNPGIVKKIAIGDFHAEFGQGLALWSGLSFGKGIEALSVCKQAKGLKRFSSSDENRFLRGLAATLQWKSLEISLLYSKKKVDASLKGLTNDTIENEEFYFSSLQETGLHTTPGEIASRKALGIELAAAHLSWRHKTLNLGTTLCQTTFSSSLNPTSELYKYFNPKGKVHQTAALDYTYSFRKWKLFGETAVNPSGDYATINGIILLPSSVFGFTVVNRDFSPGYYSLYSAPFGESSDPSNEKGTYIGIWTNPLTRWTFNLYSDLFSFPWLKYRTHNPTRGFEYVTQAEYKINRLTTMQFRARWKNKPINGGNSTAIVDYPIDVQKSSYRVALRYSPISRLTLSNRVEYLFITQTNKPRREGFLWFQDIAYEINPKCKIHFRYATFNTDDYDTRIYAYENNVLYAFSIPAYYYQGNRVYFLFNYSPWKNIQFWFRIAQTHYSNRNIISSGLTEIQGKNKTDVIFQARVKF